MSTPGIAERSQILGAVAVGLRINGIEHELRLDPRVSLLDALREHLGLTGTKKGCDQGACGAYVGIVEAIRETFASQMTR